MDFLQQKVKALCIVGDYLVIIPAEAERGDVGYGLSTAASWTLIIKKSKQLLLLYQEIHQVAKPNQKSSIEAYFQLILEGFFLLEAKLQSLLLRFIQTKYYQKFLANEKNNTPTLIPVEQIEPDVHTIQLEAKSYYSLLKRSSADLGKSFNPFLLLPSLPFLILPVAPPLLLFIVLYFLTLNK